MQPCFGDPFGVVYVARLKGVQLHVRTWRGMQKVAAHDQGHIDVANLPWRIEHVFIIKSFN